MTSTWFIKTVKHPLRFRLFLFSKLPLALLAGLRIREMTEQRCVVSVPYKWLNKNPFRSAYFAVLAMAAELSTGILSMARVMDQPVRVALLVVKIEGEFFKKATTRTYFTCNDGAALSAIIKKAVAEKQPQQFTATSYGVNAAGEAIATFRITWSFKAKGSLNV
ncbi:DUF4442 domain-containing protein [Niabella soli]|uniref:Thioesterase n=1 Tax=Niabella soli DSM 19437 TaxID=929713 RepID=W0EZ48_9BACT|nr:DUF4442 domain-containing protein [Niabella soli]AHF14469.1 thioesterase [Niabella soli DSM 19437]